MEENRDDIDWLNRKVYQSTVFFKSNLTAHFNAEEEILFPSMHDFPGAPELIGDLIAEHRKLASVIERLAKGEPPALPGLLSAFAELLESHIRKEERRLFPLYEQHVTPDRAREVEKAILECIGPALQPGNPELLAE